MAFFRLFFARKHERAGFELYTATVSAARDPLYFGELGVPDTLDGRFDLVGLFAAILIRRLRNLPEPGPSLAQAAFDAMFADMDFNLREIGVGEMSVPRKMRAMWEAFHGRAKAYETPLASGDAAGLAAALARNVWRGNPPAGAPALLARAALAQDRVLHSQDLSAFVAGRVRFLPARDAVADAPHGVGAAA
jgi:cytochrome b pre-mRNA-processing protein 3